MRPAIYLDRDGVVIENRDNYVLTWSQVELFPQALQALRFLSQTPFAIIMVTNQSAIGQGLMDRASADEINQRLIEEIKACGVRIDGVFLCPHSPKEGCACRKPMPGLLYDAATLLKLDLGR